jgi:hypothetical protein
MTRLRVPPLTVKQAPGTTFTLGLFIGITAMLIVIISLSIFAHVLDRPNEPRWLAVRLFRGFLLVFISCWLVGVNMYGWAAAGVNHVLIFEVDPR